MYTWSQKQAVRYKSVGFLTYIFCWEETIVFQKHPNVRLHVITIINQSYLYHCYCKRGWNVTHPSWNLSLLPPHPHPMPTTHHLVHPLRSIPVKALVVLMAVLISTLGSSSGFCPSTDGDHAPPMAMGSPFPLRPTRNCSRRVGCWKFSRISDGSSAKEQEAWNSSSIDGLANNMTWNRQWATDKQYFHTT